MSRKRTGITLTPELYNAIATQKAFGNGVQRGPNVGQAPAVAAGASPDSFAGSGMNYQQAQELMFGRGSDIVDQTLKARQLEMERQREEERLKLEQRKLADGTALDRGRLDLDYKRAASDHEQASRRQVLADNALLLDRDIAKDRSRLQNREMAYREGLPNDIDVMKHRFQQEGVAMLDKEASALFGSMRQMNLDPDGKQIMGELTGAYRALQAKRSRLEPGQYADMLGQIMRAAEQAGLENHQIAEPSPEDQFKSRSFDLGDGRRGYLKANGDIGVIEPRETAGGEVSMSDGQIMPPEERMRRLMAGTTKEDVKARQAMREEAIGRILERQPTAEDGTIYQPSAEEVAKEIQKMFQDDFEIQRLGIEGMRPKPIDPANLSGQANNQQAEIDALRQIGVQPKPGQGPSLAPQDQPPRDMEMENRQTVERILMQRKDSPEVQGLAKQLQKAGLADRPLADIVHPRAVAMEQSMGAKDPVASIATKAAKAIQSGKPNFLTADPMRKKIMEEAQVEVIPKDKVDALPPETYYLDEDYNLHQTPKKQSGPKPHSQGQRGGNPDRDRAVKPDDRSWWDRTFGAPVTSRQGSRGGGR